MDYFDSTAGKGRLAVVKYQATVPNKKGTLFVNPGKIAACNSIDENFHVEVSQVDLEHLASGSYHPSELRLAWTPKVNTISSLGTPAVSAPIHCELFPSPDNSPELVRTLTRACGAKYIDLIRLI